MRSWLTVRSSSATSRRSEPSSAGFVIIFDPESLRTRIAELEEAMGEPGFWDDQQRAPGISADHARLSKRLERYDTLASEVGDLEELTAIASDDELDELEGTLVPLRRELARLEEAALFPRRVRRGRCGRHDPFRHGRDRCPGLDGDAAAHVSPLGG